MVSVRINQHMGNMIKIALIKHRFSADVDALIRDQKAFAAELFDDIFPAEIQKRMEALPKGWLPVRGDIDVQFGEFSKNLHEYNLSGVSGIINEISRAALPPIHDRFPVINRRVPHNSLSGVLKVYALDHPFSHRHEDFADRRAKLKAAIAEAEKQAHAAIFSVTTVGALVKNWPEVEPFVSKYLETPTTLPALPTARLNALLDLPVEGATGVIGVSDPASVDA